MSDEYQVPRGRTLRIGLGRKRKAPAPLATPAEPSGIIPLEEDEPLYVRRGGPELSFFDLGTRLVTRPLAALDDAGAFRPDGARDSPATSDDASVGNLYLEQSYICPLRSDSTTQNAQLTSSAYHTADDQHALDRHLLGDGDPLDPFGETPAQGSGRAVPNCMPLPEDAGALLTDIIFSGKRYALARSGTRPLVSEVFTAGAAPAETPEWTARKPAAGDARERWGFWSRETGAAQAAATLRPKGAASHLAVDSLWNYESFDTSDTTNFKITAENHFDAEAVPFRLGAGKVRVYLKPQTLFYVCAYRRYFTATAGGQPPIQMTAGLCTRLPVYATLPDLREFAALGYVADALVRRTAHATRNYERTVMIATARTDALVADMERVEGLLLARNPGKVFDEARARDYAFATFSPAHTVHAGTLLGVVISGSRRFYVWQRVRHDRVPAGSRYNAMGGVQGYMSQPAARWRTLPAYLFTGAPETTERVENLASPTYQH